MANVAYAIEGRTEGGWSREAVGAVDDTTLFETRASAERALPDLATALACDVEDLRVVEAWDYEGYWNYVLGANRNARDVVREFDLAPAGLDEWLGNAEAVALCGVRVPYEWRAFHKRALVELEKATEA